MMRLGGVLLVGAVVAASCAPGHHAQPSPVVAPDASGHTALLIDHAGNYDLTSVQSNFRLPHGQLQLSPSISCYTTWHTEAVGEREVVGNPDLIRLHATLIVEDLRRAVLVGYTLGWTRLGPPVVAIAAPGVSETGPPFACPRGK